ncbi:hypothetical protein [Halomonas ventosae]|uniref:Uncharacterized protein n=1 Tax=Halomonas ventosae TaxID=229007 RepID=A0A4R6HYN5_9GAMM|nr:hypothetical protein [Halomonas ventosae]TDO13787.1 hypothetical protein DFO68_1038 [Halomonas ventosae]
MGNLSNPDANVSWINKAADKRHAAAIIIHGKEVARLWDFTPEKARERAEKLRTLQGWKNAEVVTDEA